MGMERRQVELKGGIAHFKNGNFNQALICFNKIEDADGMKVQERMLLREYWAATLERINDLPEALIQARFMITTDETSHKGYLRMGKILRLLGDHEAALKTYEMGLRRAKSGADEIATQMRTVKLKEVKQNAEAADLFNVLPETVLYRILEYAQMRKGTMPKVAMTSKLANHFVKSFDAHSESSKLVLLKDLSAVKIKQVLTGRPLCKRLVTTGSNFQAILKMKAVPNRFKSIELTGNLGQTPTEPTEYHQTIFSNLTDLKFVKATIKSDDPILFFSKLPKLYRFFAYESTIGISQKTQSSMLRKCTHLYCDEVKWKVESEGRMVTLKDEDGQEYQQLEEDDEDEEDFNNPHFRGFSPSHMIWDLFSEPLPSRKFFSKVTSLGLHVYYFLRDELQLAVKQNQITELYIQDPLGMEQMTLSELEMVEKFKNLKRLYLYDILFINDLPSVQKLSFPNLEHLMFDQCHPIPKIKMWNMPKLKTCTYLGCDIMEAAQLPNITTGCVSEVLIKLNGLHMDAKCFQTLADTFAKGKIHVLGVSNAHHFYGSNGMGRISKISQTQPFHHLIIDETQILPRIRRLWPARTYLDPKL